MGPLSLGSVSSPVVLCVSNFSLWQVAAPCSQSGVRVFEQERKCTKEILKKNEVR